LSPKEEERTRKRTVHVDEKRRREEIDLNNIKLRKQKKPVFLWWILRNAA